jgi:hypothetical protein
MAQAIACFRREYVYDYEVCSEPKCLLDFRNDLSHAVVVTSSATLFSTMSGPPTLLGLQKIVVLSHIVRTYLKKAFTVSRRSAMTMTFTLKQTRSASSSWSPYRSRCSP